MIARHPSHDGGSRRFGIVTNPSERNAHAPAPWPRTESNVQLDVSLSTKMTRASAYLSGVSDLT